MALPPDADPMADDAPAPKRVILTVCGEAGGPYTIYSGDEPDEEGDDAGASPVGMEMGAPGGGGAAQSPPEAQGQQADSPGDEDDVCSSGGEGASEFTADTGACSGDEDGCCCIFHG